MDEILLDDFVVKENFREYQLIFGTNYEVPCITNDVFDVNSDNSLNESEKSEWYP